MSESRHEPESDGSQYPDVVDFREALRVAGTFRDEPQFTTDHVRSDFYRAVLDATPRVAAKCAALYSERICEFVASSVVPPVGSIEERFGFRWGR